jgi:hypothetical protein
MSSSDELKGILALTAFGGFMAVNGWKQIQRINRVKDSSKQLISAASAGQVEIEAVAWPLNNVDTCIQGKKCIYLEVILEEYRGGKHKRWQEVWRFQSKKPFLAFDQTGFVKISPLSNFFIDVNTERTYYPNRMSASERSFFNGLGYGSDIFTGSSFLGLTRTGNYRLREKKILLGSPVLIHGFFRPDDKIRFVKLDPVLKDFQSRCMKLLGSPSFQKRFLDRNKDGSISREELLEGFERVLNLCAQSTDNEVELQTTGENGTRFYGTISGHDDVSLDLADTFEEQYLKSRSIFWGWISLMSGMFACLVGLYLFAYRARGR